METNEKNNAASRSRRILEKAFQQQNNQATYRVWNKAILDGDDSVSTFEITRLVEALKKEIELAERQLAAASVPDSLYKKYFKSAYNAININNLDAAWNNYQKFINSEVLLCFAFAAHIIDEDEPQFDEDQINEIVKLIADLKASLNSTDVDPVLKHFVKDQIILLERGLFDFRVRGSKALMKCYMDGLGEIVENAETIRENSETPIINLLKKTWEYFQTATNKAATLNKSHETWAKLIKKSLEVIDYITKLT